MLTPQDVRSVQFEKNLRGYRTEDVDHFLDKVEQQLEQDAEQMETLRKQVADLTAENETLRRNMQSYEADGDMLKSALINAQRMGENVIREANQKAEDILHRANLRGDDIIRDANELLQKASDRADEIESEATAPMWSPCAVCRSSSRRRRPPHRMPRLSCPKPRMPIPPRKQHPLRTLPRRKTPPPRRPARTSGRRTNLSSSSTRPRQTPTLPFRA